jgi:hypothetical protein
MSIGGTMRALFVFAQLVAQLGVLALAFSVLWALIYVIMWTASVAGRYLVGLL